MHYSNLSQILHLLRLSNNSTNINITMIKIIRTMQTAMIA